MTSAAELSSAAALVGILRLQEIDYPVIIMINDTGTAFSRDVFQSECNFTEIICGGINMP